MLLEDQPNTNLEDQGPSPCCRGDPSSTKPEHNQRRQDALLAKIQLKAVDDAPQYRAASPMVANTPSGFRIWDLVGVCGAVAVFQPELKRCLVSCHSVQASGDERLITSQAKDGSGLRHVIYKKAQRP